MGGVRGSIAALALAVALPVGLAACAPAEGEPTSAFELVLPPPPGSDEHVGPLTVVVHAPEGVLDGIGLADQVDVDDLGAATNVKAVPGRPDALRVGWMGGECDDRVEMVLDPSAGAMRIHATTSHGLVMSCSAVGILRAIELDLVAPIDPRFVVVVPVS
jgi:hypothetical protein